MTWAELHGVLRASGVIRSDAALSGDANRTITGVAYDSRIVEPGVVFVALKGRHADGTAFARQALERGAAAIVSEQPPPPVPGFGEPGPPPSGSGFGEPGPSPADVRVPWAVAQDARVALAQIAATFFRHPSAEMQVVGITGTNGKTTTAYLLSSIFEAAGIRCGGGTRRSGRWDF